MVMVAICLILFKPYIWYPSVFSDIKQHLKIVMIEKRIPNIYDIRECHERSILWWAGNISTDGIGCGHFDNPTENFTSNILLMALLT